MQLESSRLRLRALRTTDLDHFYDYRKDPELCRYQGFDVFTREEAIAFIEKFSSIDLSIVGTWFQIGIELKETQELIGDCGLKFFDHEPRIAEIGFTITNKYQKKGYATEALTCLLDHLFANTPTHKIIGLVDIRNTPSIRLMEKLGFVKEAHFRKSYFDEIDNDWVDEYQYGRLENDRMSD